MTLNRDESIVAQQRSLNRFEWPSSCIFLKVTLTLIDKVRDSNNEAPRRYVTMKEVVWYINRYQWRYLCAEHQVRRRKGLWEIRLLYQALSMLILHVGTSTIIEQVRMTKFVQNPVRLTLIDKVRGSNNQAPRSYVNEDGISLVHQSHSTMLTLCRTLFMLTSLVTKLAEDKERGWLVLYQAQSMMRSTT